MALARGAALASANAPLATASTVAMAAVDPDAVAGSGTGDLAYSAAEDDETQPVTGLHSEFGADLGERRSRPSVAAISAMAIPVGGVVALALGIRPHVDQRPSVSKNVVAPVIQAPAPPKAAVPAPPALSAVPAPEPAAPSEAPTPVPQLGPTSAPPQQGPPLYPRGDNHGGGDWIHRRLEERGVPWP